MEADFDTRVKHAFALRRLLSTTVAEAIKPDAVLMAEVEGELRERDRQRLADAAEKGRLRAIAPAAVVMPIRKAALIAKLRDRWNGLESDLSNAARNGLAVAAAVPGRRGFYDEDAAIQWAKATGKMAADDGIRAVRIR